MLLFSIIIMQAISNSFTYDLELEGRVKVGPDFVKTLQDLSNSLNIQRSKSLPLMRSKVKLGNYSLGKLFMRVSEENQILKNIVDNNNVEVRLVKNVPQDYIDHLKEKGSKDLKYIGRHIMKAMNVTANTTMRMDDRIKDFATKLQEYYNNVSTKISSNEIDKEYLYLDIIEMANKIIYIEERQLLNDFIKDYKYNVTSGSNSIAVMNGKIYRLSVKSKREELKYICNEYDVCRQFPTFSDYCADFISEILKLDDSKFLKFLEILTYYVKSDQELFAMVTEKEDRDLMIAKLNSISDDKYIYAMREFFAVFRAVITQRFKILNTHKKVLKNRTKAIRILLDIIDKALGRDHEVLSVDFGNTIAGFRKWSSGQKSNINKIFGNFSNNMLKLFKLNLPINVRQEISVLVELIMRGTTKKVDIYERLFKYGSNYVKGKDFRPDMETLEE